MTNPKLPGLELHIPAGVVIRDRDGKIQTQVSLTPVPVDRAPFPVPDGFPIYFMIQPGGAHIQAVDQSTTKGVTVFYPNNINAPIGSSVNFWNYDPQQKGWYVYGKGRVAANGKQIVPDSGIVLYEFMGSSITYFPTMGNPPQKSPSMDCRRGLAGDPVDCFTGLFIHEKTDLELPDVIPLRLTRTYRNEDNESRLFGIGWMYSYGLYLYSPTAYQYQNVDLILPNGGRIHYDRTSPGTTYSDGILEHVRTPTSFYKSTLRAVPNTGNWELTLRDGTVYGMHFGLRSIRDRVGNSVTVTANDISAPDNIHIKSPSGRFIDLTKDANGRVVQAKDSFGRVVTYQYDVLGRLWKVTDPDGGVEEYSYDNANRMLTVKNAREITKVANEYDSSGRVIKQTLADQGTYLFSYSSNVMGSQTDVTDPRGNMRRIIFNFQGYVLSDTSALGTPEQQAITYERQPGSNFILSKTDALGRKTSYTYDAMGNVLSETQLAGTSEAVTTSYTYGTQFNLPLSVTDPLGYTTTFSYDGSGNLTNITDPLGHMSFTYNSAGQVTSVANAADENTTYNYQGGDLISISDPLGNVSTRLTDAAGRVISTTDPLGRITYFEYDPFDRVTKMIDPLGGETRYIYDRNGNLLSVTDPKLGVTHFTYNEKDQVKSRTDALNVTEYFDYDKLDNLTQVTDRKGIPFQFEYDRLNRRTRGVHPDATVIYSYDLGNRLTQIDDSQGGLVSRIYDGLNRLTRETTPQGQVNYTYDQAGRRASMTVQGQPQTIYSYDNANRLTGISRGAETVALTYELSGRRASLVLPNGVIAAYGYDRAGHLTSISYTKGSTTLGDLAYTYDAAGQRVEIKGSLARMVLPNALSSATYNAANQLTDWGGVTLSYDANGNQLGDGMNSYAWDSRNRLLSISGGASASFAYDGMGRRRIKAVAGEITSFLYDGVNPVQELTGNTPKANLLTGLGLDDVYARSETGGSKSLLTDALGSTLALTDSAGTLQAQYTYEPYGKTTQIGSSSDNAFQYTGRENDQTGLYYFRARFYDPLKQRFIAEDPIGLAGGVNMYAYVGGNPIGYRDPFGLSPFATAIGGAEIGAGVGTAIAPGPGTLIGGGVGGLIGLGTGIFIANQINSAINSTSSSASTSHPNKPGQCNNDDECEKKLKQDEALCVAIAGPRYGSAGIAICQRSARQRYAECLRYGVGGIRTPLHGVETPL